jgi:phospholipase C
MQPIAPNVWNTTLLIGWDEPGGTYDHVRLTNAAAL